MAADNAGGEAGARSTEPGGNGLSGLPTTVISLRIIEALGQARGECGVTELAQTLDMPKARVHRHLVNLRDSGYVAQNPRNSRYSIGWRLYLLGQQLVNRYDVVSLAKPVMEALRDQLGQTVVISTYTDQGMVVLDFLSGRRAVEIVMRAGTRFNFNAVAQGKIALAYGPPELLEKTLAGPLEASTSHTITDPERLRAEVDLARRRGWADAPEEIFTGVNALAAPIFRGDGSLFGTLALTGSIHYLPAKPQGHAVEALLAAAREISGLLGYCGGR